MKEILNVTAQERVDDVSAGVAQVVLRYVGGLPQPIVTVGGVEALVNTYKATPYLDAYNVEAKLVPSYLNRPFDGDLKEFAQQNSVKLVGTPPKWILPRAKFARSLITEYAGYALAYGLKTYLYFDFTRVVVYVDKSNTTVDVNIDEQSVMSITSRQGAAGEALSALAVPSFFDYMTGDLVVGRSLQAVASRIPFTEFVTLNVSQYGFQVGVDYNLKLPTQPVLKGFTPLHVLQGVETVTAMFGR